jgi:hypothetical protein
VQARTAAFLIRSAARRNSAVLPGHGKQKQSDTRTLYALLIGESYYSLTDESMPQESMHIWDMACTYDGGKVFDFKGAWRATDSPVGKGSSWDISPDGRNAALHWRPLKLAAGGGVLSSAPPLVAARAADARPLLPRRLFQVPSRSWLPASQG